MYILGKEGKIQERNKGKLAHTYIYVIYIERSVQYRNDFIYDNFMVFYI